MASQKGKPLLPRRLLSLRPCPSFPSCVSFGSRVPFRVLRFFLEPSGVIIRYSPRVPRPLMEFACKSETGSRGGWRQGGQIGRGLPDMEATAVSNAQRIPGVKRPTPFPLPPLLSRVAHVDGGVHKMLRALILFCVSGTPATRRR
jgi:hypothetical protein